MSPKQSQVTSIMKVVSCKGILNLWDKGARYYLVQIGLSTHHEKGLKVQMLKVGSQFSFQIMR
jgi:hypothetical protein